MSVCRHRWEATDGNGEPYLSAMFGMISRGGDLKRYLLRSIVVVDKMYNTANGQHNSLIKPVG